ncbi:uncharacterized protein LOC134264730 [Saccostrea cucullata]|uniref:uncharacterized protein LOC134264730 n=1 Tax=Saccostrea cuccullata TaxID=36930 RepID=UPI002ED284E8
MPPPPILKRRHTLVGKNILPVVKKVKNYAGQRLNFAKLKSTMPIEELSEGELAQKFKDLTSEKACDILEMAAKEISAENLRVLLHFTILHANETGAPDGQQLTGNKDEDGEDEDEGEETVKPKKKKKANDKEEDLQGLKQKNAEGIDLIDLTSIDERINQLDEKMMKSTAYKKCTRLREKLELFLSKLPHRPKLRNLTPTDLRRFLVWCDLSGKTQVHSLDCKFIGNIGEQPCACKKGLSSNTLAGMITNLKNILASEGKSESWDEATQEGNAACSILIKQHLKIVKEEQAKARVLPKQAKPMFIRKLNSIATYIQNRLDSFDCFLTLREKFTLLRDQAMFKLQFFAGDRASDMSNFLTQDIKSLSDNSGFMVRHTFGKTLRGGDGKTNNFVIKRFSDSLTCPIAGLESYLSGSKSLGIDLETGYLFRTVTENGVVLNTPLSYSSIYERLKTYLRILGLDEGETPHSLRAGCAVTLALSDADCEQLKSHIGWSDSKTADYYSRATRIRDATETASTLAEASRSHNAETTFNDNCEFSQLRPIL